MLEICPRCNRRTLETERRQGRKWCLCVIDCGYSQVLGASTFAQAVASSRAGVAAIHEATQQRRDGTESPDAVTSFPGASAASSPKTTGVER